MAGKVGKKSQGHPEKLADFLDAAYCLETDDQTWLAQVMDAASSVWGRGGPVHGAIYDASDVAALRIKNVRLTGFSAKGVDCIMDGLKLITPGLVTRTFRSLLTGSMSSAAMPEMLPMLDALGALGFPDSLNLNGLDPSGLGAFVFLYKRDRGEQPAAELAFYRRMAHHLGAAHRCRRRLRESQAHRSSVDATDGAEAILDGKKRVVHATGPALAKDARDALIETAKVRELARTRKGSTDQGLRDWRPLTSARWTLVDRFERNGTKYIVARENQSQVGGLLSLSERERQVVAYRSDSRRRKLPTRSGSRTRLSGCCWRARRQSSACERARPCWSTPKSVCCARSRALPLPARGTHKQLAKDQRVPKPPAACDCT